jgi:hypothetical protein
MRRRALAAILGVVMLAVSGVPANGCGDKLLVLGRGIRLEALLGNRTAKVLAYQHAGTHGAELIADTDFQSALKNAGYQLRIVRDTEELEVALRLGKYDLILSDIVDTSAIEPTLRSAATPPALIPILYQPSKADLASVEKHYRYTLKTPRKAGGNLSVIEQALETKLDTEAKLKRKHREAGGAS